MTYPPIQLFENIVAIEPSRIMLSVVHKNEVPNTLGIKASESHRLTIHQGVAEDMKLPF